MTAESDFTLGLFDQKLDHFDDKVTTTFKERYWTNDQYWDEENGAPIFLYLCGEWTCAPPSVDSNAAFQLGKDLKARLVVHEHRYYGDSQPFAQDKGGWSYDNLKWLNTT